MYKRILVPVDGSDTSKLGLREAIKLAKDLGGRLRLLHVVDETVMAHYADVPAYSIEMMRNLEERGRKTLAAAQAEAEKRGVAVDAVLQKKVGVVADAIVDQAKAWPADMIVIGTHGRRGVSRLVMGSDAESVTRTSPVPVLLVNASALRQTSRKGLRAPKTNTRVSTRTLSQRH